MQGDPYDRPPFPAVWAKMHGKGRVFYSSMAHRIDVWQTPEFQKMIVGAVDWATGRADTEIPVNFEKVTPNANVLKNK